MQVVKINDYYSKLVTHGIPQSIYVDPLFLTTFKNGLDHLKVDVDICFANDAATFLKDKNPRVLYFKVFCHSLITIFKN